MEMKQKSGQHSTVTAVEQELARHLERRPGESFVSRGEPAQKLAQLTRTLEQKRQSGALTSQEEDWLHQIDELTEKITRFNAAVRSQSRSEPPAPAAASEHVSHQQAQEIIADFDEQFERRVVSKMSRPLQPLQPTQGRSLQELLTQVRAASSEEPWDKDEQHFDMDKLLKHD